MLYAVKYPESVIVGSATTLEEYELFRQGQHDYPAGAVGEVADFISMLSDERVANFGIPPLVITCCDEALTDRIIADFNIQVLAPKEARDHQNQMVDSARKLAELDKPQDRRTIREIHGLDIEDRWDKSDEETKAKHRAASEEMKKKREAGGVTGDSFGGTESDKLLVQEVKVKVDADKEIIGVDVKAVKTNLRPYRLEIIDQPDFDFTPLFDAFHIPQNRVESAENGVAVIKIHTFQVPLFTLILEQRDISFNLESLSSEEPEVEDQIEGHDDISIFFTVQSTINKLGDLLPVIAKSDIDVSTIVSMRDIEEGCWLAFRSEKKAKDVSTLLDENGFATSVVAVNRKAQALINGDAGDYKIIDTNVEQMAAEPRPWNSRSAEWNAMTDEEKAEAIKSIKASEFLFVVEPNPILKSVLYITPESYFLENEEMWAGDMPINHLFKSDVLDVYDTAVWTCKSMTPEILIVNMNNWGFIESLRLRIHLNNQRAEQRASLA